MLSVSEITQQLRETIQDNSDLQDIWTYGNISEIRPTQTQPLPNWGYLQIIQTLMDGLFLREMMKEIGMIRLLAPNLRERLV